MPGLLAIEIFQYAYEASHESQTLQGSDAFYITIYWKTAIYVNSQNLNY